MTSAVWVGAAVLVILAGLRARSRIRERTGSDAPRVDDDALRRIMDEGAFEDGRDEPLDLERAEEEERRFWEEETWDEAEEL